MVYNSVQLDRVNQRKTLVYNSVQLDGDIVAEYDIVKYENRQVMQSNPLNEACKAMELYEGKLYYLALLEFNFRQDNIDGNAPLPELVIPTDVVLKVFGGNKTYYKRLKDAASSLYDISFARTEDGKILLADRDSNGIIDLGNGEFAGERIFTSMKFSPREGGLIFRFSENIKPEIHKLFTKKGGFTLIKGKTLFSLSSMYAIRLIEMLLRFQNLEVNKNRGYILLEKSLQDLRLDLNILKLKTYENPAQLKLKILEPAREDINTNTPYKLDYTPKKKGKKITGYEFKLYYPENVSGEKTAPTDELINDREERRAREINVTANVDNLDADIYDVLRFYGVTKIVAKRLAKENPDRMIRDNIRCAIEYSKRKKVGNFGGLVRRAIEKDLAAELEGIEQTQLFQPSPEPEKHKGDGRQLTEEEQRAAEKMNAFWYGDKPEPEETPVAVKPSPAPEPEPTPEDKDRLTVSIETIKGFVDSGREKFAVAELAKLAKKGISLDDIRTLSVSELEAKYKAAEAKKAPEQEPETVENIPDLEPEPPPEQNIFEGVKVTPEHEAKAIEEERIYDNEYAQLIASIRVKVLQLNQKELRAIKDSIEKDKPEGKMLEMRLQQLDLNKYDAYLVVDEFIEK